MPAGARALETAAMTAVDLHHWPLHRLTRRDYEQMIDAGIFGEDDHVELLNGAIVDMSPQYPPHADAIRELTRLLVRAVPEPMRVGVQVPLALGDASMPEPDLCVIAHPPPVGEHPASALLVVEVAASSARADRIVKGPIYAAAGVPEYWIVDVGSQHVEVHREPLDDHYGNVRVARPGDALELLCCPGATVDVAAIFGL
jgi:Uma2 family endonuclease